MSVNSYSKGQPVLCTGTFRNVGGSPADATTPLFAYKDGAGTWHRGLTPTHGSTGVYTYTIQTRTPKTNFPSETWYYTFYTPEGDPLDTANQSSFTVTNAGLF